MTERTGYMAIRDALRRTFKLPPPPPDPEGPDGVSTFMDQIENFYQSEFGCSLDEFSERLPRTDEEGDHRQRRGLPWLRAAGEERTLYEAETIKIDTEAEHRIKTALLVDRGVPRYTAEIFMRHRARELVQTTETLITARAWWNLSPNTPKRRHLMLSGNRGVGKTYAAVWTIGQLNAVDAGADLDDQRTARFISAPDFADIVYDRMSVDRLERFQALCKPHLLIIDDLGQEPMNDRVAGKFYQLVNGRHEAELRTVYTTHLVREDFEKRYGAPVTDRIYSSGKAEHFRGESLR